MQLDDLREKTLSNFELILEHLNVDYRKVTENEYDILATWRTDRNFGSVRFNTEKGRGADFAGGYLGEDDYSKLGVGFSAEDFAGYSDQGQAKIGFDIIGLFQRVFNTNNYQFAAEKLKIVINEISSQSGYVNTGREAYIQRLQRQQLKEKHIKKIARDIWESCKHHKFEGSLGQVYLQSRGIYKQDPSVRFHPGIQYAALKTNYPALIFRVQKEIRGPVEAIHRIYLDHSGKKAKIDNPKMALAPIKGLGIWFGEPNRTLYLTEGPENALSLMEMGVEFAVSSIYGTNLHNLTIPKCVKTLIIYPDVDPPGMAAYERAQAVYGELNIQVEGHLLEKKILGNQKMLDINDLLRGNNG